MFATPEPEEERMRLRIIGTIAVVAVLAALVPAIAASAHDNEGESDKLEGVIASLPGTAGFVGDWVVSGTTVHVTADTEIEQEHGPIAVGATVEVERPTFSESGP